MKIRYAVFMSALSLFFLTYPGNGWYVHVFANNRDTFNMPSVSVVPQVDPVPYVINKTYNPDITAEGAYVTDLQSFSPIFEKNSHEQLYPASTTKIITALVAYDVYKPSDVITVTRPLEDGQVMGLVPGEKMTVENLLYGALIYSGNDAAYALADGYGYDRFITLMNKKAHALHMTQSTFINPAGLDDPRHVTTPYDLALAARALLQNPYLRKIVAIKEITISDIDFTHFHQLNNVNELLGEVQGIGGLKTGYTPLAGENLVSFYRYNHHDYLIVILKSTDRFTDTKNIIAWIQSNIAYSTPSW